MSASPLIPKEQQSAYQRWELGSFESPGQQSAKFATNAARVQQIDAKARADGFAAGHREGLEAARHEALLEANIRVAGLDQMMTTLTTDLARLDRELAQEVVQLGLAIARKLVGETVRIRPDVVRDAVEEALRHVAHIRGPVTLVVSHEDAPIVRAYLESAPPADGWSLREDAAIARGGCRVETAAGEVEATIGQRWHRITAALGQPTDWIE